MKKIILCIVLVLLGVVLGIIIDFPKELHITMGYDNSINDTLDKIDNLGIKLGCNSCEIRHQNYTRGVLMDTCDNLLSTLKENETFVCYIPFQKVE